MSAPAPQLHVAGLADELREAHVKLLRGRIKAVPTKSVRASSIGKECARELFYEQTAHEMRTLYPPELQAIFDLGNQLEGYVVRLLEDMGYVVEQRNRSFDDRQHNITGHLDGRIWHRNWPARKSVPIEIKGLNPYTADSITTLDDIRSSRQAWVRKYYAQLQLYQHLDGDELGIFVLLNKSTGWPEFIESPIDRPFIDTLLKRADVVKEAVLKGEPPERHRTPECRRCPFAHVCLPDIDFGPGAQVVDEPELIEAIRRREEHREGKRAFESADRVLKSLLEKQTKGVLEQRKERQLLVGPYNLVSSTVDRKSYVAKATSFVTWEASLVGATPAPATPAIADKLQESLDELKAKRQALTAEASKQWDPILEVLKQANNAVAKKEHDDEW